MITILNTIIIILIVIVIIIILDGYLSELKSLSYLH